MKIEPTDPPRIVDEDAPAALRELVRSTQQRGPGDAAMQRMSKGLATAGVLAPAASVPNAAPRPARRFGYHTAGIVALAVAGALVLSWRATQTPLSPETSGAAAAVAASARSTNPESPPSEASPVREQHEPNTAAISVDDLPSAEPRAALASSSRGSGARTNVKAPADGDAREPTTELELVQRAQTALAHDPERALAVAAEHARAYPSGELVQEREVIAVEALARLGRKEEALRRARSLVQRFPRTPYAARLEKAVGQPVGSTTSSAGSVNRQDPPPAATVR